MDNERQWGEVGTKLIFENHRVRIWELALEPGESSHWHTHKRDYVTVGLTESRMRRHFDDGTSDETVGFAGRYTYADKHQPHEVTNVGDTAHRNILIEIKE